MLRAILYLIAISIAEVIVVVLMPVTGVVAASVAGIACHTAILLAVIIDSALSQRSYHWRLVLSLSIVPLVRIISLSMPLAGIDRVWQFAIIYLPLLAAAIVVIRLLELKPGDIGLRFGFIPVQLGVGLVGIGLGFAEYYILAVLPGKPLFEPLAVAPTWQAAWLPALVLLVSTGFVEELIFRGVLQKTATEFMGGWGIVYVSLIFAVMHVGFLSWPDVAFVFAVALLFGWVVSKTGSILGITLAHGATNIVLYIVARFFI